MEISTNPESVDDLLADLQPLNSEQLGIRFEERVELVANQPEDELAFKAIRQVIQEVERRGDISMAMQVAMTLGAMACTDPHFEELSGEAGKSLGRMGGLPGKGGHGHPEGDADISSGNKRGKLTKSKKKAARNLGRLSVNRRTIARRRPSGAHRP